MSLKIGSLCSGYGGLDLAVESVLDARTTWVSDVDKGACKVLAHRFPDVPNIGDMTAVDWSQVEPVDVITGGTPCQDLSHAGKRAGMTEGTRSNLWVSMREAIATIRPGLVVWENVGGAYSAAADSDMESREGRLGDRPGRPALRALGRVLGDLASLGYVGGWHGLRAADVGAPHGRLRVFVVARTPENAERLRREEGWESAPLQEAGWRPRAEPYRSGGVGTGRTAVPSLRGERLEPLLLPTPLVSDSKQGGDAPSRETRNSYELSSIARLLPTPTSMDSSASGGGYNGQENVTLTDAAVRQPERWGQYADAIARWEQISHAAPEPYVTGPRGNRQLSAGFSEWMMGLPAGWITDVPDVTRNEALKLCGNGVVPQQAEAALRYLLPLIATGVAA